MITQQELKEALHYNPITGIFTWRITRGRILKGSQAGYSHKQRGGYINIGFKNKNLKAHRLAFLYMTGNIPEYVDHIDKDRSNNRWDNLRGASITENNRNCNIQKNNTSGVTGVHKDTIRNKWVATISHKNKCVPLGRFNKKADAITARKEAEKQYNYQENHGKTPALRQLLIFKENHQRKITKEALDKYLLGTSLPILMKEYQVSKCLIEWMEKLSFDLNCHDAFEKQRKYFKKKSAYETGRGLYKAVVQLDKKGTIIQEYPSMQHAAKATGICQGSISNVCSRRTKTAGGFIWQYK